MSTIISKLLAYSHLKQRQARAHTKSDPGPHDARLEQRTPPVIYPANKKPVCAGVALCLACKPTGFHLQYQNKNKEKNRRRCKGRRSTLTGKGQSASDRSPGAPGDWSKAKLSKDASWLCLIPRSYVPTVGLQQLLSVLRLPAAWPESFYSRIHLDFFQEPSSGEL